MKKNKIVKILLVITLLVGLELPVIAATTGTINVDTVRVREKATTKSDIVELVSIGDKIDIIGQEDGEGGVWYKVKIGKKEGYIRNDLITVKGDVPVSTQPDNNEETPDEEVPFEETPNEGVTSEETPTENNPAEEVPNEEPNESNDETVQVKNKTISTLKSAEGVSAGEKVQLTEEIEIKILPSANSTNIEKLAQNTEVTVLEVINKWCRVETEGACGWVRIDQ